MTTNFDSGSATIYQFPARGRFAENARYQSRLASSLRRRPPIGTARRGFIRK